MIYIHKRMPHTHTDTRIKVNSRLYCVLNIYIIHKSQYKKRTAIEMQNVPIKMVHLFSCLSCFYRFYLLVDHFTIHTLYLAQPFKFLPCLDLCKGIKFAKRHQRQSNRVFLLEAYSKRIYISTPKTHSKYFDA